MMKLKFEFESIHWAFLMNIVVPLKNHQDVQNPEIEPDFLGIL